MPANYVFLPIEGNFKEDINLPNAVDRYCIFILGNHRIQTSFCEPRRHRPHWNDIVNIETPIGEEPEFCYVEVREKSPGGPDELVGFAEIPLKDIQKQGRITKWFDVKHKNELAGQILVEIDMTYTEHDPHLSLHLGTKVHGDEMIVGNDL